MNPIHGQNPQSQELAESLRAQKKQKEELQASHEREMENLKKAYSAERAENVDRFESAAQNDRLNHYEHLRNLKNQINREERDLEKRGNAAISDKTRRLQKEEVLAEQEGRKRVESTLKKYAALEEYERRSTQVASEDARKMRTSGTRQIMASTEEAMEKLQNEKTDYVNEKKQVHSNALDEINLHYKNLRDEHVAQHRNEMTAIEEKGFRDLNQKRIEHARTLSTQEDQRMDPFYQLHRFQSSVSDEGQGYRLIVKVPPHEKKNLKLQANGQHIQIIGVRTSDQEAFETGRTLSTRTHQILAEKINLNEPIDPRGISRMETENGVEFHIPKFGKTMGPDPMTEESKEALRDNQRIAKQIRFAETLPTPSFPGPKTGKGTLG